MPDSPNSSSPQSKPGLKLPGMEPTEAEVASAIGSLEQSLKSLPDAAPSTKPLPSLRQLWSRHPRKSPGLFWLAAGVILPALVVLLEATTGFCASVFFDPLPTVWHLLVAAFVPAANFLIWLVLRKEWRKHRRALGWLSGAAIGGAAFYTLVFLPLMPLAPFALIIYGLGLLPMAPLFALITSITGRRYLCRWQEPPGKLPGLWPGLALTLIVLAAATLPDVMTRFGLEMAASADAATSRRGDAWLRWMAIGTRCCGTATFGLDAPTLSAFSFRSGARSALKRRGGFTTA